MTKNDKTATIKQICKMCESIQEKYLDKPCDYNCPFETCINPSILTNESLGEITKKVKGFTREATNDKE